MIDEIHVHNLALIEEACLQPAEGLTVLTGETGAGKTALLGALKLLMGERADSSMVREGCEAAEVEGRVFLGAQDVDGTVVARRLSADGRSRVRINGALASVGELSQCVGTGIDLCGQHEHQRLLDASTHVGMLDAWAGKSVLDALAAYQEKLEAAKAAAAELARVQEASRMQGSRVEQAREIVDCVEEISPQEGELEHLEELLPRAQHAETLASTANDAYNSITGEGGALDGLNDAVYELQRMASLDPKLQVIADQLSDAVITVEDAGSELRRYRDDVDFNPAELKAMQGRYNDLQGLLHMYGPSMADVFAKRDEAQELLLLVDDGGYRIERAQAALRRSEDELYEASKTLAKARAKAAPRFCDEVGRQMARLEMGRAELVLDARKLPREQWGPQGSMSYEFLYRSGAGLTPRPLKRVASGGELSRVMLACKVALGETDHVDTLVFDEVDAGVGGSTARALAAVLADLAKTHQVIVVSHLAQVAVLAHKHYVVSKSADDTPKTLLRVVEGDARVAEVARMLSGDATDASLAHAREMLGL